MNYHLKVYISSSIPFSWSNDVADHVLLE